MRRALLFFAPLALGCAGATTPMPVVPADVATTVQSIGVFNAAGTVSCPGGGTLVTHATVRTARVDSRRSEIRQNSISLTACRAGSYVLTGALAGADTIVTVDSQPLTISDVRFRRGRLTLQFADQTERCAVAISRRIRAFQGAVNVVVCDRRSSSQIIE